MSLSEKDPGSVNQARKTYGRPIEDAARAI